MYNKIASITLNSAKAAGLSDVFVAQPDSLKENLAGKIFVLAEIGGKKTETKKIFDFIVSSLGHNYYNDEKILFRDKIEGLKIENIFEAALTKTNKDLAEFLLAEKIKLSPAATSITLGVVFEDKLHFANFGHNRSVLIYQRGGHYELINVEANAAEFANHNPEDAEVDRTKLPKLFSSVISGEIPLGSYFLFGSEALLEYLSSKELIDIITKLPPMTAAEQIKNVLNKINNYVPFLGLIIKNTVGLSLPEFREETYANTLNSSAHSSISSLNYTEQKTEQMLAPAGLISFSKITKNLKHWLGAKLTKSQRSQRKYSTREEKNVQAPLDLGVVKSLNLARSDSFLKAEKIFFKHESNFLLLGFKKTLRIMGVIFSKQSWQKSGHALKNSLISLNLRNRYLLFTLGLVILVLVISLSLTNWSRQRRIVQENFDNLVSQITEKTSDVTARLLYDEEGAGQILLETQALLATLPQETKAQKEVYDRLSAQLKTEQEKIQKVVKAEPPVKINDLSDFALKNITFVAGKIFASSDRLIYSLVPGSTSYVKTEIPGVNSLQFLSFDKKDKLFYADSNKVIEFNIKTRTVNSIIVNEPEPALSLGQARIFNSNLYALRASQNQIYRYTRGATSFGAKSVWLKEAANLSAASDLLVDGDIYVLQSSGQVMKFFKGQKSDYKSLPVSPVMTQARKILAGQNYLYIFEPASKRLVVLSRSDGHLTSQYIFDSLNNLLDFTVDESTKSVYFLASSSLWKVQLK